MLMGKRVPLENPHPKVSLPNICLLKFLNNNLVFHSIIESIPLIRLATFTSATKQTLTAK